MGLVSRNSWFHGKLQFAIREKKIFGRLPWLSWWGLNEPILQVFRFLTSINRLASESPGSGSTILGPIRSYLISHSEITEHTQRLSISFLLTTSEVAICSIFLNHKWYEDEVIEWKVEWFYQEVLMRLNLRNERTLEISKLSITKTILPTRRYSMSQCCSYSLVF